MNINIPAWARDHFWEEPPEDSQEFWGFRWPPPCKPGDPLIFRFDKVAVAEAVVDRIEKPGESRCDRTNGFERSWKVFWRPETFRDLRCGED